MAENNSVSYKYSYGNSTLPTSTVFKEREKFDRNVFPNLFVDNYFDFWASDLLYGRIDTKGNPIYIRESNLKQLRYASSSETLFAANFVADAWRDLCDKIRDLKNRGIITDSGPYADMEVVKSWRSPATEYHNYMVSVLFPVFSDIFMSLKQREDSMKDFGTFLKTFTEFAETILSDVGPLTFSGFLETGTTSPFSSALVIEIAHDDHNDDFNKLQAFYYDPNFDLVSTLCTQYGFSVDKNAPWRFVADIGNPAMQEYIFGIPMDADDSPSVNGLTECEEPIIVDDINSINEPFGYSEIPGLEGVVRHAPGYRVYREQENIFLTRSPYNNVFDGAYKNPFELDLPFLEVYLLDFYNRHIIKKPFYEEENPFSNVCNNAQAILKERSPAGPEIYDVYSKKWSLKTFYLIRSMEKGLRDSVKTKLKEFRKISSIFDLMPGSARQKFSGTLRYIIEVLIPESSYKHKEKKPVY